MMTRIKVKDEEITTKKIEDFIKKLSDVKRYNELQAGVYMNYKKMTEELLGSMDEYRQFFYDNEVRLYYFRNDSTTSSTFVINNKSNNQVIAEANIDFLTTLESKGDYQKDFEMIKKELSVAIENSPVYRKWILENELMVNNKKIKKEKI